MKSILNLLFAKKAVDIKTGTGSTDIQTKVLEKLMDS